MVRAHTGLRQESWLRNYAAAVRARCAVAQRGNHPLRRGITPANIRRVQSFDLLVIGGGVNGTGIARDAAMRGISTCLIEKKDFAAGASGANTGMIHGGVRY